MVGGRLLSVERSSIAECGVMIVCVGQDGCLDEIKGSKGTSEFFDKNIGII